MIPVDRCHLSYEGEGDLVGLKTFFCHYPGSTPLALQGLQNVGAVFINADRLDDELWDAAMSVGKWVTIEVPGKAVQTSGPSWHGVLSVFIRLFVVCDDLLQLPQFTGFVKVRVMKEEDMAICVELANAYASQGRDVLLMPEFTEGVGEVMMRHYAEINPSVRVAPPMQYLIGIT